MKSLDGGAKKNAEGNAAQKAQAPAEEAPAPVAEEEKIDFTGVEIEPLFLPLVSAMGIDLIRFGLVMAVNLTIGMCILLG